LVPAMLVCHVLVFRVLLRRDARNARAPTAP
jgi:hypothetical protein